MSHSWTPYVRVDFKRVLCMDNWIFLICVIVGNGEMYEERTNSAKKNWNGENINTKLKLWYLNNFRPLFRWITGGAIRVKKSIGSRRVKTSLYSLSVINFFKYN